MIWISIVVISFLSALSQKCEKIVGLFSFVGLGYLMGISTNYQYNNDAFVYKMDYLYKLDSFESGYNYIANFSSNYLDYETFRLYSCLLLGFILFLVVLVFTHHVSTISLFYSIAIYMFDNFQIRNAMASIFILIGLAFLIKLGNKGLIFAIISIFVGSLFHSLAFFFMIIPLLWMFRNYINKKFNLIFIVFSVFAFLFEILGSNSFILLISNVVNGISTRNNIGDNILNVYNNGATLSIWLGIYILTVLLVIVVQRYKDIGGAQLNKYAQCFQCLIILWLIGMILISISIDYIRILRIVSYVYIIFVAELTERVKSSERIMLLNYSVIVSLVFLVGQSLIYGQSLESFKYFIGLN